ncbi:MAG: PEP-CTERM sorting domain-containing protein [Scytonema sp. CRU_2_7]|nr:PEP-CTERM sorting domain-containing protein [Scytonema sp. CRU_2_7]
MTLSFSGVATAIFNGRGTVRNLPTGTSNIIQGTYPISGDQYLEGSVTTGPLSDPNTFLSSITFSEPVAALGFYATGISDYFINPPVLLELTRVDGTTQKLPIRSFGLPFDVTVQYYGVIAQDPSEEFIKVRFLPQSSRSDGFGLDDITVAKLGQVKSSESVPEPLTILGSLAAGGIGVALRRKFKQQKETAVRI